MALFFRNCIEVCDSKFFLIFIVGRASMLNLVVFSTLLATPLYFSYYTYHIQPLDSVSFCTLSLSAFIPNSCGKTTSFDLLSLPVFVLFLLLFLSQSRSVDGQFHTVAEHLPLWNTFHLISFPQR